jgi:hypothetical protein
MAAPYAGDPANATAIRRLEAGLGLRFWLVSGPVEDIDFSRSSAAAPDDLRRCPNLKAIQST